MRNRFFMASLVIFGLLPAAGQQARTPSLLQTTVIDGHKIEYSVPQELTPKLAPDGKSVLHAVPPVVYIANPVPPAMAVRIPPPAFIQRVLGEPEKAASTFAITYIPNGESDIYGTACVEFPAEAQAALNAAAAIWGNLIKSTVPITIKAGWADLGGSTLGYSGGGTVIRDFAGAPKAGTWYGSSLANSFAGSDLVPSNVDMHITYNKNFSWYYGTNGITPAGTYDFMSVVLHEIAHGLNFAGSMSVLSGQGKWGYGTGYPNIYDTFQRDGSGTAITDTVVYPNPSSALTSALTSGSVWFHGPGAMAANVGQRVKLYAPSSWASGSSNSHLDYSAFAGTANRLMVYAISSASSIHDPGPVAKGLLTDLGWVFPNSSKAITAFNFNGLTPAVTGVVDEAAHAVALVVPIGTAVTSLVPTIAITGSSISPASGVAQNFTSPKTYTVTAADSSTQAYTVTVYIGAPPAIGLSKTSYNFGTERYGTPTPAETLLISNTGAGILSWTATPSTDWISVLPGSGTGYGSVSISVSRTNMSPGYYTGTVTIASSNALNSPRTVNIGLDVLPVGTDSPPFGNYASPADGAAVVSSIPVTGWVLDDVGVQSVKIYRGTGLSDRVYIGDAVFSRGARPDVEAAYPGYPQNDRAGWGYMLLTNFLPNGGNGPVTLLAYATDTAGQEVFLGSKTITCDNLHAVKPFGAIDTPGQGGTVSGSAYVNFGWALTPQPNSIPTNGSTLTVFVNGLPLGHPTYNNYRSDLATLFPGYANSNGAVGYYYLNTTGYANGMYTIAWLVIDSFGNADGIGSRYFTIQNVAGASAASGSGAAAESSPSSQNSDRRSVSEIAGIPEERRTPVYVARGYSPDLPRETVFPESDGSITIRIPEVSRIVVYLEENETRKPDEIGETRGRRVRAESPGGSIDRSGYGAYELVRVELRTLPIGATFDTGRGILYWQPGPGFLGDYDFIFVDKKGNTKKAVKIHIGPK